MQSKEICDFFGINEHEYDRLVSEGITTLDFIKSVKYFQGSMEKNNIGCFALEYYIDTYDDFSESDEFHAKIANAMYKSMNSAKKAEIINYFEDED